MKNFKTILHIKGKTVAALSTWRNARGTAYVALTVSGPSSVGHTWEAKSSGPSWSADYDEKVKQALERLSSQVARAAYPTWPKPFLDALMSAADTQDKWVRAVATAFEANRCGPI